MFHKQVLLSNVLYVHYMCVTGTLCGLGKEQFRGETKHAASLTNQSNAPGFSYCVCLHERHWLCFSYKRVTACTASS